MLEITIETLKKLWQTDKEFYRTAEVGSGVQKFCKKVFACQQLFNLKEGSGSTKEVKRKNEFLEEAKKKGRKADVVIFIDSEIIIPVEVEKHGNIKAGVSQIYNYQADWVKKYGILTDGYEWRFYNNKYVEKTFFIDQILENPTDFLTFWEEYTTPEYYYLSFFRKKGTDELEEENIPHLDDVREDFFKDITKLIGNFKNKLNLKGYFKEVEDETERNKKAVEITYAYLIQFILYKTLVDNSFVDFEEDWKQRLKTIDRALNSESYGEILRKIQGISNKISENIYKRFSDEQEIINSHLKGILDKPKNEISDVSVWLDILLFINRYNFANVKNEIFGYVYENFLKDLYLDEKKGQYFTDPLVVDFMLNEIGYNPENLKKRYAKETDSISIIDPSCGSGTFLYNATHRLVEAFFEGSEKSSKLVEQLVNENIFGLDIAEFPLYLAEMNIIMRMLPLVIQQKYNNPIDQKIKVLKTRDSIAEFLDTAIKNTLTDVTTQWKKNKGQLTMFTEELDLGYESFMRDKRDLDTLKTSLENRNKIPRYRFDFVIGNPPYVSYNECSKQHLLIFDLLKEGKVTLNDIYGVNLHSVPEDRKKNRPNPNLYLFFISLGLALLKDRSKISYIIPQTLLTAGDFNVMRYHLAKFVTIDKIITFDNAMFIQRGIDQRKMVATSSLIFVISKIPPHNTHNVEIIRHRETGQEIKQTIHEIFHGKKVSKIQVSQQSLLKNFQNWNFILFESDYLLLYQDYRAKNIDIGIYSEHILADTYFKSNFYFDGGYSIDESHRLEKPTVDECYIYPRFNNKFYTKVFPNGFWPNIRTSNSKYKIELRQGSQEYNLLDSKYKIVWSYANPKRFFFTDEKIIWARNQFNAIGSENKKELLYLFALLNSQTNWTVLIKNVKSENEKDILFSLKAIKKFVKVPEIKDYNKKFKDEIITQTENLLSLENSTIANLVDFKGILQQKFDSAEVKGNDLVICYKANCIKCKITGNALLVNQTLYENLSSLTDENGTGSITELKNLPVIDFEYQGQIKSYIDDLVFALYFKVKLPTIGFSNCKEVHDTVSKHKFYKLINN
ncbi:MAG: hypothetical protein FJY07_00200 [Bacteroidetes bacterium]|nr:hypothetical protein [Bacteroidota bacterium]